MASSYYHDKARPRCRPRRQMVGVLMFINPKGVGQRMVVDRQKVKTRSESRRYRVADRLMVKAAHGQNQED